MAVPGASGERVLTLAVPFPLPVALVSVYALITNPLLIIAIGFLFGGFVGINKFGGSAGSSKKLRHADAADALVSPHRAVPEPSVNGDSGPVTQKQAYTVLFVVGIPLLWLASPVSTIAYVVGLSAIVILGHASMLEPGVVSDSVSWAPQARLPPFQAAVDRPCLSEPASMLRTRSADDAGSASHRRASTATSRRSERSQSDIIRTRQSRPGLALFFLGGGGL